MMTKWGGYKSAADKLSRKGAARTAIMSARNRIRLLGLRWGKSVAGMGGSKTTHTTNVNTPLDGDTCKTTIHLT